MTSGVTYRQQVSFCGKTNCRACREGKGHGPYWFAYETRNGQTVRTYVGTHLPPGVQVPSDTSGTALLRLFVLGRFRLERRTYNWQWQAVPEKEWQGSNATLLLGYLLASPARRASRAELREALWPGVGEEAGHLELEGAVTILRQLLQPSRKRKRQGDVLRDDGQEICLAGQEDLWVDADAFEALLDSGNVEQLLQAQALYGGEFLPEERTAEWATNRRQFLRRRWVGILLDLADRRIAAGNTAGAVEFLDRLLAADPTNEAATGRLMVVLARVRRRGEALQLYQRFVEVLRREHGLSPSQGTKSLFEALQRGEDVTLPAGSPLLQEPRPAAEATRTDSETPAPIGRSHQSPLVGRDLEQESVRALLLAAKPGGRLHATSGPRAQCMLLFGEAGIGKTRLAEEAAREAQREGWSVLWGRAYAQEGNISYRVWTDVLRMAVARDYSLQQEVERHAQLYQPLVTLLPEWHALLPEAVLPLAAPAQAQLRLWEAARHFLLAASERAPLLIVLDDMQWADGSSCELFGYLVRQIGDHPIVVVGTCRESELPSPLRALLSDLQRERKAETLSVGPLGDEQIRALIAPVPDVLLQRIQIRAAGNPFFAEELARGIGSAAVQSGQDPPLPETIAAALEGRLSRLSNSCQQLLGQAAVLGGSFDFSTIYQLVGALLASAPSEELVLDLLDEALRAGLLTEEGTGTRITYAFWHPLLVSHLYSGLSATRRASLHRRSAEILRQGYQGREDEGAALITHHLIRGGAEASQISREACLAGDYAYVLSAYHEASRHYRLAIEQLEQIQHRASPEEQQHLAAVLERLGECAMIEGNYEEARSSYERVLALRGSEALAAAQCETQREAGLQALIWCEVGWTWRYMGDNIPAWRCCERGEQVLQEAGVLAGPAWASLRYLQSSLFWREGRYEEAERAAREALALFERAQPPPATGVTGSEPRRGTRAQRTLAGDPVNLGRVQILLAAILATVGKNTDAADHLTTALTIFERYDCQREIAIVSGNLGDLYLRKAQYTLAQAAFRRSLVTAERIGDAPIMSVGLGNLGVVATRLGDLMEGESLLKRGLALAERIGDPEYTCLWLTYLAHTLQEQGKSEEACACILRALKISRTMAIPPCTGFALMTLGQMRIAQAWIRDDDQLPASGPGRSRLHLLLRARATLQRALLFEGLEAETRTEGRMALAEASLVLDDLAEAEQVALAVLEEARRDDLPRIAARSQRLLGSILALRGEFGRAVPLLEEGLRFFRDSGMRVELARSLQSFGLALLREAGTDRQSRERGFAFLQEARREFLSRHAICDLQGVERALREAM